MDALDRPRFLGHVDPLSTWSTLSSEPSAYLVDVRTDAEWAFVGGPDLSAVGKPLWRLSWRRFPDMSLNMRFVEELVGLAESAEADAIFFLCRSGARSAEAAQTIEAAASEARPMRLINVAEGFEGDLDPEGRRGGVNGWKARGLPWRQS